MIIVESKETTETKGELRTMLIKEHIEHIKRYPELVEFYKDLIRNVLTVKATINKKKSQDEARCE